MDSKLDYAIASLKTIVSLRQMFKRIAYNLSFEYHCRKLREIGNKPFIIFCCPHEKRNWVST